MRARSSIGTMGESLQRGCWIRRHFCTLPLSNPSGVLLAPTGGKGYVHLLHHRVRAPLRVHNPEPDLDPHTRQGIRGQAIAGIARAAWQGARVRKIGTSILHEPAMWRLSALDGTLQRDEPTQQPHSRHQCRPRTRDCSRTRRNGHTKHLGGERRPDPELPCGRSPE